MVEILERSGKGIAGYLESDIGEETVAFLSKLLHDFENLVSNLEGTYHMYSISEVRIANVKGK